MRKKRAHEEHENHERWLVSYADFITLLFAFFVVLYATSSQNEEKEKKFEENMRAEFKLAFVGGGQGGVGSSFGSGGLFGNVIDSVDAFPSKGKGALEVRDFLERALRKNLTAEERQQYVANLKTDAGGVRLSLAAQELFAPNSVKLKPQAMHALESISQILIKSPYHIQIEGHTDRTLELSSQPSGQQQVTQQASENAWDLASLRATQIVRYLIKVHKLPAGQLSAVSYGDTRPVASNSTEEGRNKNRRIEIYIQTQEYQGD
jgi:chemotaxis protein MotB